MRRIGNDWRPASLRPILLFPTLALALLMAGCAASTPPEEVVDAYLSDTTRGDAQTALERWELSQLGPTPIDLDPGQHSVRLEARRELAQALTEALSAAGDALRWESGGLTLYDIRDGIANPTEYADDANVATVEVSLAVERSAGEDVEEQLAFTLWKGADGGWRITGLDKGLLALEEFLEELRGSG